MFLTLWLVIAWFILYQIAKSSVLAVVMLIALCRVLMTDLSKEWMRKIDVATWFLILASDTTMVKKGSEDALSMISSNFLKWFLMSKE